MIENRQVSRVFATRVCNFPAIQFDTQVTTKYKRRVASLFAPELHFDLEPIKFKESKSFS